jgi:hypothetical protein
VPSRPSLDALSALLDRENVTMVRQIKKLCEGCGREYYATRSDQRFHSAACKAQHHRDIQAVEEGAPIDLLAQALIRAFSLRVAGSVEAPAALGALLPLLLAEVEPSTPTPIAAPANDHTDAGELAAAPALDAAEVLARLQRVREGDKRLTQKAIAEESGVDQSSLSRFISGARALGSDSLDALDRYLTEHERKVKPR